MNDRRFPPFFFVLVLVEEMFDVAVMINVLAPWLIRNVPGDDCYPL